MGWAICLYRLYACRLRYLIGFIRYLLLYSIFFTAVYISSSLILRVILNIISISTLSIPYLPPALALGISLLLVFKVAFNIDSVVAELGFILEAVYNYSLIG